MEPPAMESVYQAINTLYDNPNSNEKEKASIWLGDVQKSIHSWKVADELLRQKKDINSTYFGAQTMRSKIQHNLSELPADALVQLRDTLVSHLETPYSENSTSILTQLCLALADLALQMVSWQNSVSDIIKSFSNKNNFALLEILTVLPQEIDSTNLKLGENRRADIKNELRQNSETVVQFLKESLTDLQNSHVALRIVKCMTSWLEVGAVNIQEVPQNTVIGFCLQVLRDHNSINVLHDVATDCLCALLHCIEDNSNNDDVERLLFESVAALEESYHMAVAHEDDEKAANYARIFTELAESFLTKLIMSALNGETHFAMRSLELALVCVGHHDYETAQITFNLWYRLSEEVYQRDYQPLTDVFKPYIERLIEALARHCQCEPDVTQLPAEGDDFYEFRVKVMDLIKDVVFIVGSSSVFRQMFNTLSADTSWEQTEAALFVMMAVAKNILPDEYEYVPKVVEAILGMPESTVTPVRHTCLQLLGELSDWIERHPACLPAALALLVRALHDAQLAASAAEALQKICKSCRGSCGAGELVVAARAGAALPLGARAALAMSKALAAALSSLPHPELTQAMREAVSIHLTALTQLMDSGKPVKKNTDQDPVLYLDRIAALFRDVEVRTTTSSTSHPCVPALSDAWPVIQRAMEKYESDVRVMERVCRCVRFALRCAGRHAAALLPPLSAAMARVYAAHAHSCLLYLASVLVDELACNSESVPQLIWLLEALMPRAFQLLQHHNGLKDNPDTVDDFFRLCIRFLQRIPVEFLAAGAARLVTEMAARAAALDHRDANSSVMKYLFDLIKAANSTKPDKEQVKGLATEILKSYGETITYSLLEASVLHLHSYMLAEVAEVFVELVTWQRAHGVDWVQPALQRLPRDSAACATQQQCWQFHQYAISAEKYKEMTKLLRDFARLYR